MDYGTQNGNLLYAASQTLLQQQPQHQQQQQQAAAAHIYSSYYSAANPTPYPNQIAKQDDPSQSSLVYADAGIVPSVEAGFDGQAASYGAFQAYQHTFPFAFAQPLAAASYQLKKKSKNNLDLNSKKQKVIEGGAAADSVKVCTICNVVCNSAKVFASHLAGEKHAIKALGKTAVTLKAHLKQTNYTKKLTPHLFNKSITFVKPVETLTCDICKVACNSQETFNTHKMGKKHRANLQKLQEKLTPKPPEKAIPKPPPAAALAGKDKAAEVELTKKASAVKEDLQLKKSKVLQGGAAEAAIMTCPICDVVCNSVTVYNIHISGKKHLSMVKKQVPQV